MKLSPAQTETVSAWIADGASIAEVQKRLRDEFQVSLTFMDTRFLIDDLGLNLKAAPPPQPPPAPAAKAPAAPAAPEEAAAELVDDEQDPYADEFADDAEMPGADPAAGGGNVKVEIDRLTRPGTVVSGTVAFSDGSAGKWALDQYGRIMFEGANPGQRPSQADLQAFQMELSRQLQRKGY